ncbi:MAG: SUF system NifU family Fe-S cluster assembly protein [Ignavibacteria bacterium]
MSELSDLYQEVILDHNKSPRNFRICENCNHDAEGFNPLCGDHIFVYLNMSEDKIQDISFQGTGCAISKSSASMMTTILKGKTKQEAEELFNKFHEVVTSKIGEEQDLSKLGKLAVFSGVRDYPARVKCASLAWHTLLNALKEEKKSASTEQ